MLKTEAVGGRNCLVECMKSQEYTLVRDVTVINMFSFNCP